MCIAMPARVEAVGSGLTAMVAFAGGRTQAISIQCVPDAGPGDYVLVNLGMAVRLLDPNEAATLLQLWDEIGRLMAMPAEDSAMDREGEA